MSKLRILGPAMALCLVAAVAFAATRPVNAPASTTLSLPLRAQIETTKGSGEFRIITKKVDWDPKKTAAVVCDMWDKHWSTNATARVGEMAPRMNELLTALRKQGVLIIHCPSDTMDFYKDTPQRKRAQSAPPAKPKTPLARWRPLDRSHEPPLPIDDSDGGDDSRPHSKSGNPWRRQIAALTIADEDAVTDSTEAYNLMRQRGIENVLVMGVHLNMCVLGRPFAIRQLVQQELNVALVRDLTDTMYNPERAPFVSHFTGTDLMIDHVERWWCPTITSADVLGGKPFRFKNDTRKHLVIISAEDEYRTAKTLPAFARTELGKDFRVSYVYGDKADRNHIPGLEILDEADVAIFSARRWGVSAEQMAAVKRFVKAGKGVIGVRTASHGFSPFAGKKPAPGVEFWPTFDQEALGCHYTGHYAEKLGTKVQPDGEAEIRFTSWLYKVSPLAKDTKPRWTGKAGDNPPEPVAWTFTRPDGGRTFSTTLGHPDDFGEKAFVRLLRNGVYWTAGLPASDQKEKH
jgi:nicotinamidase-related amidase